VEDPRFQMFECTNPACGLRFPTDLSTRSLEKCPFCGSKMREAGEPYANYHPNSDVPHAEGARIRVVLENLRSALNVGSIFRTANGAGVSEIVCCGTTPTPQHPKVQKSSLGAEIYTPWRYAANGLNLVREVKQAGDHILALEWTPRSLSLFDLHQLVQKGSGLTLILGNEISGIDPQILQIADQVAHLPMYGVKTSINVAVTAGIALYHLVHDKSWTAQI